MRGPLKPFLISCVAAAVLIGVLFWEHVYDRARALMAKEPETSSLMLYCAAGMKEPVARIAEEYERLYGVPVQIQYGGSGTLLSSLRVADQGDLYLAADSSYIDLAREQGLLDEAIPVAMLRPVIVVSGGNPKNIRSVQDLLRDDVRTSLGLPSAASIGKQTEILLTQTGEWREVEAVVQKRGVFKPTVNEVANDVKIGVVDAGIVWDATVNQYPGLEAVPIAGAEDFVKYITIGVLRSTQQPTCALHFARYLTARDKGLVTFDELGFPPVEGDLWAEKPEILYFSGGVNRVGIQDTLREFEEREGVRITTVFTGCGILLGQIKLGERPDVYHTCDASFMKGVENLFSDPVDITETNMIILVPKGNPRNIRGLADLAAPGLRLGVTNEEQSALGALTVRLLKAEGLYDSVVKNVVARTPTADLLVNQIRTGALDAVVVYEANAVIAREYLDVVPIVGPISKAVQTFARKKESDHPQLLARLYDAILAAESQERLIVGGFRWIAPENGL